MKFSAQQLEAMERWRSLNYIALAISLCALTLTAWTVGAGRSSATEFVLRVGLVALQGSFLMLRRSQTIGFVLLGVSGLCSLGFFVLYFNHG